jgi:hypothetical protein
MDSFCDKSSNAEVLLQVAVSLSPQHHSHQVIEHLFQLWKLAEWSNSWNILQIMIYHDWNIPAASQNTPAPGTFHTHSTPFLNIINSNNEYKL